MRMLGQCRHQPPQLVAGQVSLATMLAVLVNALARIDGA
jgi:hypothetical protein